MSLGVVEFLSLGVVELLSLVVWEFLSLVVWVFIFCQCADLRHKVCRPSAHFAQCISTSVRSAAMFDIYLYKFRMLKEFRSIGVFAAFSRWSLDICYGPGSAEPMVAGRRGKQYAIRQHRVGHLQCPYPRK